MASPYPPPGPSSAPYYGPQAPPQQNTLGLMGFIFSLMGFACALGFPIGLILSLMGLRKEPKVFAIIGTVVGGLGTLGLLAVVLLYGGMIVACIGFGAAMQPTIQTEQALRDARSKIEDHKRDKGAYPNEAEGNALVQGITDYWKKPLRYEPQGDGYVVRSAGPDGQFDTGDDLHKDNNELDLNVDVGQPTEKFELDPTRTQETMPDAEPKSDAPGDEPSTNPSSEEPPSNP